MYHAQIAVAENGNLSVRVLPPHQDFPPMALPGHEFPNALAAESYVEALLRACRVIGPDYAPVWISAGYTLVQGRRYAVRSAPIPTV